MAVQSVSNVATLAAVITLMWPINLPPLRWERSHPLNIVLKCLLWIKHNICHMFPFWHLHNFVTSFLYKGKAKLSFSFKSSLYSVWMIYHPGLTVKKFWIYKGQFIALEVFSFCPIIDHWRKVEKVKFQNSNNKSVPS